MLILNRNCPSCGTKTLPVFVFRRDRRRICDGCGNSFRERFRPPWLSDLVIVCITVGSVLLLVDILPQEVKDYLGGGGFILTIVVSGIIGGGVLPAYLLNRTVPLKVAGGSENQRSALSREQVPVPCRSPHSPGFGGVLFQKLFA